MPRNLFSITMGSAIVGGAALLVWLSLPGEDMAPIHASLEPPAAVDIDYPYDGTVFPPESLPPTFRWSAPKTDIADWRLTVRFADGASETHLSDRPHWTPAPELWRRIKEGSAGRAVTVTVQGMDGRRGAAMAAGAVTFETATEPVGAPLFYREVPLPFIDAVKDPSRIRWRFGAIDAIERPRVVLEGLPVCGNCHSFSSDGRVLGMDVDYANDKGSYVIAETAEQMVLDESKVITWSDYRREDAQPTFGLLSQVSPDGRYAVSTVKDRSIFVPRPDLAFSQLFFPLKGILAFYDRETGAFRPLPGADDPAYVHSNPTWSPDGEHIVFARAKAYDLKLKDAGTVILSPEESAAFLNGEQAFRFDLYRIPFNDGRGGEAVPLEGASGNGKSNFFAKFSPDGRWIVFCQAESFMLLQPDSELFIIPSAGGPARRLACNRERMNSWHSFSPNGRWLVFASKADGPYTRLYLSYIDAEGRSAPPVRLSHLTAPDRAANIPEFVNLPPDAIHAIREQFVDDESLIRTALENVKNGDLRGAEKHFRGALAHNPDNVEALTALGGILADAERPGEAIALLERAVDLAEGDSTAHYNLGNAMARARRYEEAVTHWRRTVALDPRHLQARNNLGAVLTGLGRYGEAEQALTEAVARDPSYAEAHRNLADLYRRTGRAEAADEARRAAVRLEGGDPTAE